MTVIIQVTASPMSNIQRLLIILEMTHSSVEDLQLAACRSRIILRTGRNLYRYVASAQSASNEEMVTCALVGACEVHRRHAVGVDAVCAS